MRLTRRSASFCYINTSSLNKSKVDAFLASCDNKEIP